MEKLQSQETVGQLKQMVTTGKVEGVKPEHVHGLVQGTLEMVIKGMQRIFEEHNAAAAALQAGGAAASGAAAAAAARAVPTPPSPALPGAQETGAGKKQRGDRSRSPSRTS